MADGAHIPAGMYSVEIRDDSLFDKLMVPTNGENVGVINVTLPNGRSIAWPIDAKAHDHVGRDPKEPA